MQNESGRASVWAEVRPSPRKIARWIAVHAIVIGSFGAAPVFQRSSVGWFAATLYVVSCLGVSVGMHRGVIHGAFRMRPWLQHAVVYLCCFAAMGGPSAFVQMHRERDYHQDQPTCPTIFGYRLDPLRSYAQMVFCEYAGAAVPDHHPSPPSTRWMRLLDAIYLVAPLPAWALLWWAGGWNALWWGGLLPAVAIQNLFWASNYLAHTRGYQTWPRPGHAEQGFNDRLLGALSFGEGFHNNHHQFPWSARMGLGRAELDLGYLTLRGLVALRLAWDVRVATPAITGSVATPATTATGPDRPC